MAVDLHNCELLLPSDQFFSPEDHLDGLPLDKNNNSKPINKNGSYLFGSSDAGFEFSSPIGSELSSSSTESSEEEDDYIGELTRQMAQYMLQDEDKHEKARGLSGSPGTKLWSQLFSTFDSPAGLSREPSPPLTPMIGNFEKVMINEERSRHNQGERFTSTSTSIQSSRGNPNVGYQSKQALIDDQLRAIQFQRLKQEQAMKQMEQKPRTKHYESKGRIVGVFNNGQKFSPNSNNPWSNLQQQQQQINQQAGSDTRAVFLNAPCSRNGSCGTGVFLPRGTATPFESRKKQGCAKVLIPARVVQSLKLHFEKTDACASGRNSMYSHQKHQSRTVPAMNHQEMGLPQEWTY
ncbi:hypothetical protein DITRI_Ditri14bG0064100 [Diplodiscus trichospermus]